MNKLIGYSFNAFLFCYALSMAGCSTQAKTHYVPPHEITELKPTPGYVDTVTVTKKPIPGKLCRQAKNTWHCRPTTQSQQ